KAPDVPVFHNEKSKDTVSFSSWFRQLNNKLQVNADHFQNDFHKMVYVESRLGGAAMRTIEPYLDDHHPNKVSTTEELLNLLEAEYRDPTLYQKSVSAFNQLVMGDNENFDHFKNRFVRLAGEARRVKADWKNELHMRLNQGLATHMGHYVFNNTVDFEEYCRIASGIALSNRMNTNRGGSSQGGNRNGQRNKGGGSNNNGGSSNTPSVSSTTTTHGSKSKYGRPSKDEIMKLMKEGRCFICREQGHVNSDCPNKD
ncbi:hypothetical protein QBC35DRAFT_348280, partial [Podospora australis]